MSGDLAVGTHGAAGTKDQVFGLDPSKADQIHLSSK